MARGLSWFACALIRQVIILSVAVCAENVFAQVVGQSTGTLDFVYMVRIPETRQHAAAIQTGFRLRGTPGIVTALHGVVDGNEFSAINDKNRIFGHLVLNSLDIDNDVAVLISNDPELQSNEGIPTSNTVLISGALVRVLGHPLGIDLHLKAAQAGTPAYTKLSHLIPPAAAQAFDRRQSPSTEVQVLDIESPLVPGDSGAPVLDERGAVAAIVDGGLLGGQAAISWAMPINSVHFQSSRVLQKQVVALARQSSENLFAFELDTVKAPAAERILWQVKSPDKYLGTISGTVSDINGGPLAGVQVKFFRFTARNSWFSSQPVRTMFTDQSGRYEASLPPGGYDLTIHKESYETKQALYLPLFPRAGIELSDKLKQESPVVRRFTTSEGGTVADDPETAQIVGRITDFSGNPIVEAFVTATTSDDTPGSWNGRTVKTDQKGNFRIIKLRAALYDLAIEARGFRTVYLIGIPTLGGYAINVEQQMSILR